MDITFVVCPQQPSSAKEATVLRAPRPLKTVSPARVPGLFLQPVLEQGRWSLVLKGGRGDRSSSSIDALTSKRQQGAGRKQPPSPGTPYVCVTGYFSVAGKKDLVWLLVPEGDSPSW